MASNKRRKKRERKPNLPQAASARQPRTRTSVASGRGQVAAVETEDLSTMYAHVRRDLLRITILGVLLCAAIYASQFIAL